MAHHTSSAEADTLVRGQDVARWLTFSGFWGFISYMLACASVAGASKRQPVRVNASSTVLGLGIHVASFVALGSATAAAGSLIRRKPTTEIAAERISGGELERPQNIALQGLGSAIGSVGPLALAVISQQAAERIAGRPAVGRIEEIRWPLAVATMGVMSLLTATAVTRITGWVARDARSGKDA